MSSDLIAAAAQAADLEIPPDCMPGTLAHFERCAAAAKLLAEFPLPAETEVAPVFSHDRDRDG